MQPDPERPDVTVVIPTHGFDAWLLEAVSSARSQTVPVQVIVVDDGSPEPIADALPAEIAERVQVVRIPHSGVARARNAGLAKVTTPYVLFLDADDRLLPDCVEQLAAQMLRCPGAVASGGHPRYISSDGKRTGGRSAHVPLPLPMEKVRAGLLTPWPVWAALVSTAAARAVGGFDDDFTPVDGRWYPEDLDFWAKLAAVGEFTHCRCVVGEYRINPRGSTATKAISVAEGAAFVAARVQARAEGRDLRREDFHWRPTWNDRRRLAARTHFFAAGAAFLNREPAPLVRHLGLAIVNGPAFTVRRLSGMRRAPSDV